MTNSAYQYVLYAYCRRGGVSRDDGQHDQGNYPNDTAAIRELMKSARWLLGSYDTVGATIQKDGKTIYRETLYTASASPFRAISAHLVERKAR